MKPWLVLLLLLVTAGEASPRRVVRDRSRAGNYCTSPEIVLQDQ